MVLELTQPPLDDAEYLEWLSKPDGGQFLSVRQIDGERWAGVKRLLFHATLMQGTVWNHDGADQRWCYATEMLALAALVDWEVRGFQGEPEGWHRHPNSGRRRPDGDANREYIAH